MLNDLFEQIFHSEATFKERIAHLKQVNSERQIRSAFLKDLERQHASLVQSCRDGQSTLVAATLQNDLQAKSEAILARQREEEERELNLLRAQQKALDDETESMRHQYVVEATAFYAAHDLTGKGREIRMNQNQHEHTALVEEVDQLQQEAAVLEAEHQSNDQLAVANAEIEAEIKAIALRQEELNIHVIELRELTACRTEERSRLEVQSLKDPEFKRLQQELETAQGERYEALCKELSVQEQTLQEELARSREDASRQAVKAAPPRQQQYFGARPDNNSEAAGDGKRKQLLATRGKSSSGSTVARTPGASADKHPAHEAMLFENFWSDDEFDDSDAMMDASDVPPTNGTMPAAPSPRSSIPNRARQPITREQVPTKSRLPRRESAHANNTAYLEMHPPVAKKVRFHKP